MPSKNGSIRSSLRSLRSRSSSTTSLSSTLSELSLPGTTSRRSFSNSIFGRPSITIPPGLPTVEEESNMPKLDREIDLMVVVDEKTVQEDLTKALETLMPVWTGSPQDYPTQKLDPNGPSFPWSKLPSKCKQRIFQFCFPPEKRKISLSRSSFTEAVFPQDYFACPWDVLDPVWGLLEACHELRNDTLTYFWSQHHFHITLNEFTGKFTCPLSHDWALPNLHLIQRLTIERDFTRLAGSDEKAASGLSFKIAKKVQIMIAAIVVGLLKREEGMTMAELHLMARKYAGMRPKDHTLNKDCDVPYVPQVLEDNCAPVGDLLKIIKRCRVSGFSHDFSMSLLRKLFQARIDEITYCSPNDRPWPRLPSDIESEIETPWASESPSLSKSMRTKSEPDDAIPWSKEAEQEMGRFTANTLNTRNEQKQVPGGQLSISEVHKNIVEVNVEENAAERPGSPLQASSESQPGTVIAASPKIPVDTSVFPAQFSYCDSLKSGPKDVALEKDNNHEDQLTSSSIIGLNEDYTTDPAPGNCSEDHPLNKTTNANPDQGCQALPPKINQAYDDCHLIGRAAFPDPDCSIPRSMSNEKMTAVDEEAQHSEHFPDFVPDLPAPAEPTTKQNQTEATPATKQTNTEKAREVSPGPVFDTDRHKSIVAAMNEQNEQDAAFQRTINALKRHSDPRPTEETRDKSRRSTAEASTPGHPALTDRESTPRNSRRAFFSSFSSAFGLGVAKSPKP